MGFERRIDRAKVKVLVDQGLSDSEVADELDCCSGSIQKIRSDEFGIRKRKGHSKIDKPYILELIKQMEFHMVEIQRIIRTMKKNQYGIGGYSLLQPGSGKIHDIDTRTGGRTFYPRIRRRNEVTENEVKGKGGTEGSSLPEGQ